MRITRRRYSAFLVERGARILAPSAGAMLQRTASDCGVAVVREALRSAGASTMPSVDSVSRLTHSSSRGTTLTDLSAALTSMGWRARRTPRPTEGGVPPDLRIAHLRYEHFVLVRRATRGAVWVFDPLVGEVMMPRPMFDSLWTGAGLAFDAPMASRAQ